jgi:hypothetical protein
VSTGVAQGRSSDEVLGPPLWRIYERSLAIERIGLEAGPLSQWLYGALAEVGLPVICVETRHMKAALSAQINKSDRNDARGIAQMMRVGLYRPVHVKTLASQKRRMLLTSRQLLQAKARHARALQLRRRVARRLCHIGAPRPELEPRHAGDRPAAWRRLFGVARCRRGLLEAGAAGWDLLPLTPISNMPVIESCYRRRESAQRWWRKQPRGGQPWQALCRVGAKIRTWLAERTKNAPAPRGIWPGRRSRAIGLGEEIARAALWSA